MTNATKTVFQSLHQLVQDDPAIQARLFALDDPAKFIAAVQHLAQSLGFVLEESEVQQAMREGNKGWFERKLP